MKCVECGVIKLTREFLREPLTEKCDHPLMHCLRCTVKLVEEHEICPYEHCDQAVDPESMEMSQIRAILESMFYTYISQEMAPPTLDLEGGGDFFLVTVMNGGKYKIPYKPDLTIHQVKKFIEENHQHEKAKQRLMVNGKEAKTLKVGGFATLADYDIEATSTVYLMVVLFAIPDDLKHILFQLYWGVPAYVKCDFLDASCFLFDKMKRKIGIVDYADETIPRCGSAVEHSGDEMDRIRRIGSHRIEVNLCDLPPDVTYLVFTLSAWDSPRISKFKDPLLKVVDGSNIFHPLCEKSLSECSGSQTVVVCCVYRVDESWTIFESGCETDGNTDNYTPIENYIRSSVLTMCE